MVNSLKISRKNSPKIWLQSNHLFFIFTLTFFDMQNNEVTLCGKQYANIQDTASDIVQSCHAHYLSLFLCLYFIRWTELIKDVVLHTVESF